MRATIYRLSELRAGDRIVSIDGTERTRPLVVEKPLGHIAPGSPVLGVHCGVLAGGVEMVLYPAEYDGHEITIDLPI